MDPVTIINVAAFVVQLLDLITNALKDVSSKRRKRCKACQDALLLFQRQLKENLQSAKDIDEQAGAADFRSKSLDDLQKELREFLRSARILLNSDCCKKEDIQQLRELAMGKLQSRMTRIAIEMCIKIHEDVKAIKEMLTDQKDFLQKMVPKNYGVQINIFSEQARGNPMLTGLFSHVTQILCECVSKVPTEASKDKADVGMIKGVKVEAGRIKEDATKYGSKEEDEKFLLTEKGAKSIVLEEKRKEALVHKKEEEKKNKKKNEAFLMKEAVGLDVLEKEKNMERKEVPLLKDTERRGGRSGSKNSQTLVKDTEKSSPSDDVPKKEVERKEVPLLKDMERSGGRSGSKNRQALVKDMEKSSSTDDVPKKEEKKKNKKKNEAFLTKEEVGMDVLEKEKNMERKGVPLLKDMERHGSRSSSKNRQSQQPWESV